MIQTHKLKLPPEFLCADRVTVWMVDHQSEQCWTRLAIAGRDGKKMEIRIPVTKGLVGEAVEDEVLMIEYYLSYNT
jgi:hypothetical protein